LPGLRAGRTGDRNVGCVRYKLCEQAGGTCQRWSGGGSSPSLVALAIRDRGGPHFRLCLRKADGV
jgi:hypothetical protein